MKLRSVVAALALPKSAYYVVVNEGRCGRQSSSRKREIRHNIQIQNVSRSSLASSEHGTGIRARLTGAFAEIVGQIAGVNSGLAQITSSFEAASGNISQVNDAVGQIARVTQSQAATSE